MSTRKENNNQGLGFLDGLGSIYGNVKDSIWGKDVSIMNIIIKSLNLTI